MYHHDGEDVFVFDCHVHYWDARPENVIHEGGDQFIEAFFGGHQVFTPPDQQMDEATFRKYDPERFVRDVFVDGYVDLAMFQPTYLRAFYETGFNTIERNGELAEAFPERFVLNGWFDPRDGEEGLEYLEWQKETFDIDGVKLYTAAWHGDSKGYRLDTPETYEFLEKCKELGIKNVHPHKGPTIRPLNQDAFDVNDVDEAATLFPDLNFVVEHSGVPRLDDFLWFANQEPNVYGSLALITGFAWARPSKFKEILGEMLFWLGEDRVIFGSDYAICQPRSLVESIMDLEFTDEEREEYKSEFTLDAKKKFLGENLARLYDVDLEERIQTLRDDEVSRAHGIGEQYENANVQWAAD